MLGLFWKIAARQVLLCVIWNHQRPWNWRQVRQALPIFLTSSQKATKSWHWPGNQCSSVSVQHVNVHIVDAVNSIVWQKLLRVLNLRKTSIVYTVSSLDKTSDISKLEQFHISDIYLDCKGAKVLHITYYSMDADQMCSESGLHMFNQFKLHIKMNLKALFVSWSYLKRRFNVSSKVSSEIDWIWGQMLRQSTWFTWAA